jgi:hypothetical protein
MATLDELAQAFVLILKQSPGPQPLPVDLRNHLPAQASYLTKRVIDLCAAQGVELARVRIDPSLAADMQGAEKTDPFMYKAVPVEQDTTLHRRLEFFRSETS